MNSVASYNLSSSTCPDKTEKWRLFGTSIKLYIRPNSFPKERIWLVTRVAWTYHLIKTHLAFPVIDRCCEKWSKFDGIFVEVGVF